MDSWLLKYYKDEMLRLEKAIADAPADAKKYKPDWREQTAFELGTYQAAFRGLLRITKALMAELEKGGA